MKKRLIPILITMSIISTMIFGCAKSQEDSPLSVETEEQSERETDADNNQKKTKEIGETATITSEKKYEKIDKSRQSSISDEDVVDTFDFDDRVLEIKADPSQSFDEQLTYIYSEIEKISEMGDYGIRSVDKGQNGVMVHFNSGLLYYYPVERENSKEGNGTLHISTLQPSKTTGEHPLPNEETDAVAASIESSVDNTIFDLNLDDFDVTYDSLYDIFKPNSVVIWDGHGGYNELEEYFFLPLGMGSADAIIGNDFLKSAFELEHIIELPGRKMAITADFIIDMDVNVNNSVIFLDTCHSMHTGDFGPALLDQGASLVYGYSDTVDADYSDPLMYCILNEMCTKDSESGEYTHFETASKIARAQYGEYDPYGEEQAIPCICGDREYHFDSAIANFVEEEIRDEMSTEESADISTDLGEIYMQAVTLDDFIGFDAATQDFISYTEDPDDDVILHGSINGEECLELDGYDNTTLIYETAVDDYTLCGVYPGQQKKAAQIMLNQNGLESAGDNEYGCRYIKDAGVSSSGSSSYYLVFVYMDGDTVSKVSITLIVSGAG